MQKGVLLKSKSDRTSKRATGVVPVYVICEVSCRFCKAAGDGFGQGQHLTNIEILDGKLSCYGLVSCSPRLLIGYNTSAVLILSLSR
jgi:hypothetical protein